MYAVDVRIRSRKSDGYNTCPFDIMVSNYNGIVHCLNDNFSDFLNDNFLELRIINNEYVIYNKKYNFIFNHESPGHANLYITENWEEGINHFVVDNYRNFKKRFSQRIQNFRNYLSDPNNVITFVMASWNKTQDDITDLKQALEKHYPQLKYSVLLFNHPNGKENYIKHLLHMNYTINDNELSRLF
jgi:hypothetical protein